MVRLLKPRIFRGRSNPLEEYESVDFKASWRLTKDTYVAIMIEIGPLIERNKLRAGSIAVSACSQLQVELCY